MKRTLLGVALIAVLMTATIIFTGSNTAYADCPDGTPFNDVIICDLDLPVDFAWGGAGNDRITIDHFVTVFGIEGNEGNDIIRIRAGGFVDGGVWGDVAITNGNDSILNNGIVDGNIHGDGTGVNGGNDTIINNGIAGLLIGDIADGVGGVDVITNNGEIEGIIGDGNFTGALTGAADWITNNGEAIFICGDVATDGAGDSIVNNGIVWDGIQGDCADDDGGDDTIINNGDTGWINGDSVGDVGGDDYIENNGNVWDGICGDAATFGGDDTIVNNGYAWWINGDCADVAGNDVIINNGWTFGINSDASGTDDGDDYVENNGGVGPGGIYTAGGDDVVVLTPGAYVDGWIDGGEGSEVTGDVLAKFADNGDGVTTVSRTVDVSALGITSFFWQGNTYTFLNFEWVQIWR
jgi:hypothetical protein